jgi:hypothetical protein
MADKVPASAHNYLQKAYERVIAERNRYQTALEELKMLSTGWGIHSDPRGVVHTLVRNALTLSEPLYVMQEGKWEANDHKTN